MIDTAVIAAAGFGTRWLPWTKAVSKELLPLGTRPIVDWNVIECAKAGITNIYLVVHEGETMLRSYYGENTELIEHLRKFNKQEKIDQLQTIPDKVNLSFIELPTTSVYGTGHVVCHASKHIPKAPFIFTGGDDVIMSSSGNDLRSLMHTHTQSKAAVTIGTRDCASLTVASSYGVVEADGAGSLISFVEKPEVPKSTRVNLGLYAFSSSFASFTREINPADDGELRLTDAIISAHEDKEIVKVQMCTGQYYDCGAPDSWLKANTTFQKLQP